MDVLIAGGAGDIGQYLAHSFTLKGFKVKVIDKVPEPEQFKKNWRVTYFHDDLSDKTLIADAVKGSELVINLAWSFADDPYTIFDSDIQGTHESPGGCYTNRGCGLYIY